MRALPLIAALSGACVVENPGVGDTYDGGVPLVAPPIAVNYRHLDVNPVLVPSAYPDAELIDLYLPSTITPTTPILLWVHGGGWTEGTRKALASWALHQVGRGYIVASMGYRLAYYDAAGVPHDTFPAAVEDVKLAVRFMKALGPLLGGSSRVILAGASAGGHLSSFVGATPGLFEPSGIDPRLLPYDSTVSSVVNIVGPTDLASLGNPASPAAAAVSTFLGCPRPTVLDPFTCPPGTNFAVASLAPWLDASDPPTYFGYGGIDNWVPAATQGAPAALALYLVTGEKLMSWYDLADTAWHDLDGDKLNMTALEGFLDATRDGYFDALRAQLAAQP
jgi:acetyl esterase/lipase